MLPTERRARATAVRHAGAEDAHDRVPAGIVSRLPALARAGATEPRVSARVPTPANPTGPAYRGGAPFRTRLAPPGARGRPIVLTGTVLHADGRKERDAVLDVWHASSRGMYDMFGSEMRYRGRVALDDDARFRIETIAPHGYLFRPPHVHCKARVGGRVVLTTQLYLPGDFRLRLDPFVDPMLILEPEERDGTLFCTYDIVLP